MDSVNWWCRAGHSAYGRLCPHRGCGIGRNVGGAWQCAQGHRY
ncbi:hypothetical protein [Paractinoplanes durhamensis]|nr:hypothetical protein [Actinoplanes durhamensis]